MRCKIMPVKLKREGTHKRPRSKRTEDQVAHAGVGNRGATTQGKLQAHMSLCGTWKGTECRISQSKTPKGTQRCSARAWDLTPQPLRDLNVGSGDFFIDLYRLVPPRMVFQIGD